MKKLSSNKERELRDASALIEKLRIFYFEENE